MATYERHTKLLHRTHHLRRKSDTEFYEKKHEKENMQYLVADNILIFVFNNLLTVQTSHANNTKWLAI